MLLFGSSFFSELIGVGAIYGAFIVGLIIPHEDRFAIDVTEKVYLIFHQSWKISLVSYLCLFISLVLAWIQILVI
jgi:hypothetical protein